MDTTSLTSPPGQQPQHLLDTALGQTAELGGVHAEDVVTHSATHSNQTLTATVAVRSAAINREDSKVWERAGEGVCVWEGRGRLE